MKAWLRQRVANSLIQKAGIGSRECPPGSFGFSETGRAAAQPALAVLLGRSPLLFHPQ
jgi:hypothetical protein